MRKNKGSAVIIVMFAAIIMILVGAGVYFLLREAEKFEGTPTSTSTNNAQNSVVDTQDAEEDIQKSQTYSNDNSLESIQADVESTDLSNLDSELDDIEAELENY